MKKTVLQERILTLYNKCDLIFKTGTNKIVKWYYNCYSGWFDTVHGDRRFKVYSDGTFQYFKLIPKEDYKIEEVILTISFNIFNKISIQPMVGMTPHEIDMIIYEIEQNVERYYIKAESALKTHNETIRYFQKQC